MNKNKNNSPETGVFVSSHFAVAVVVLLAVLVLLNLLLYAQMYRMSGLMYNGFAHLYDVAARMHDMMLKMRVY